MDQLLATKLHKPQSRSDSVPRPRLVEQLNTIIERKLALVSAPAGYGKTTLLGHWQQQASVAGLDIRWLSLDDHDNDPARFWSYLTAALRPLGDDVAGHATPSAQSIAAGGPGESAVVSLINDLTSSQGDTAIVFDDYHVIHEQSVHDMVLFFLDHMPPQVHLVVASRVNPPLPLAKLRARNELVEILPEDLRFTEDEATELVTKSTGLDISSASSESLHAKTEGWGAGLQMAALSLKRASDVESFVRAFKGTHRDVFDYLAEEVLYRQPSDIQSFLLKFSISSRVSGPLCDAIFVGVQGQKTLEAIERDNLFLNGLDNERSWYRFHQLFAGFLREQLHERFSGQVDELHGRAARWFEENGLASEAVKHYLAASEFMLAAKLVESESLALLMGGARPTLSGWLDALPDNLIGSRPQLSIADAWAQMTTGRFELAEERLVGAETALARTRNLGPEKPDDGSDAEQHMRREIRTIRAYLANGRGDTAQTIELSREVLAETPEEDSIARSCISLTLGAAYMSDGKASEALEVFADASRAGEQAGDDNATLVALDSLAGVQVLQGRLRDADETLRHGLRLAAEHGNEDMPIVGNIDLALGDLLIQWNRLDEARERLDGGLARVQQAVPELQVRGFLSLSRLLAAEGSFDGAREMVAEAKRVARTVGRGLTEVYAAIQEALLWTARGDLASATRWAKDRGLAADDKPEIERVDEYIALARILVGSEEYVGAIRLLNRLHGVAEAAGRIGSVSRIEALQTVALELSGSPGDAESVLLGLLNRAEPEGYVRLFVDEGQPMTALLRRVGAKLGDS